MFTKNGFRFQILEQLSNLDFDCMVINYTKSSFLKANVKIFW